MEPIKKSAEEVFDIFAEAYDEWMSTIHTYDATLNMFCNLLQNEVAVILDSACGPGNISRYLLNLQSKYNVTGIDLSPKMISLAKQNLPEANFKVMDFRNIKKLNQQFDGIICGFGLPYINREDATQFIKDACHCLNPGGVLYISIIEGEAYSMKMQSSSSGEYETQMYYHEGKTLKNNMLDFGMKIILEERIKSTNKKGESVIDLIVIGQLVFKK